MSAFPVAGGDWRQSAAFPPLYVRDFRLFWCGSLVSRCGDQLQIIGLAILALNLTQNRAALGAVLAAQAIPRTLFIVIGGVIIDRFRPSAVLRVANLPMTILVGVLATLSATGLPELGHLYGLHRARQRRLCLLSAGPTVDRLGAGAPR